MTSRAAFLAFLLTLAVASVTAIPKPTKLLLRAAFKASNVKTSSSYPNETSILVQSGPLYQFGESDPKKAIGFAYGQITVLYITPTFTVFNLDTTYEIFGSGKLIVQGTLQDVIVGNYVAITGGTQKFAQARGEVIDTFLNPPYKFATSSFELKLEFFIYL